ncbi:uncharacterized protein F5891DRAFT_1194311 [Suillus fuscotomentosus]|uniref:Uncharacterized protein n=1 Tax=Suillus fuscotomentosus TaxID=1912939 RepID=A0AAD4HGE3_9AGAM|nr:uncharacterized protein F5891DRAFT_1194311 [Suillus fuscotomentosus]KAG1895256.1 hypothetical protein F5891DRAFT_1194311 [Suillus fuscotomentosus]
MGVKWAYGAKLGDKLHKSIDMHAKLTPNVLWVTNVSHNIFNTLNLHLSPVERADVVKGHLSRLNFLHKAEIVDDIEPQGLYVDINRKRLDCVSSLAGAAVHSALKAYHEGIYENVNTSTEQFYNIYSSIIALINRIRLDDVLKERYKFLCRSIIRYGEADLGL